MLGEFLRILIRCLLASSKEDTSPKTRLWKLR
ncbi:hypothetical protein LINPERHAP2_LOCUS19704 [Linum perenne]